MRRYASQANKTFVLGPNEPALQHYLDQIAKFCEGDPLDYDDVVVGSGAADLTAAISAATSGASVMIIEVAAGLQDKADAMFEHYMTPNQRQIEAGVIRRYYDLAAPTFE